MFVRPARQSSRLVRTVHEMVELIEFICRAYIIGVIRGMSYV